MPSPTGVAGLPPQRSAPPVAPRPSRPRGRGARGLLLAVAAVVAVLVLAVSASGYALVSWSSRSIERIDAFAGLSGRPEPNAPGTTTFLLVGSDGREDMTRADQKRLHVGSESDAGGRRADTMLLVHVSSRRGKVEVVSLPRDSYVTIPAHTAADGTAVPERRNKLNAAYAFGGPSLAVATVERSTGIHVDHYLEVDFLGFVKLVDAVGGVDVCTPTRLRDKLAGLRLPAGNNHVDGRTGLAYVRARNLDARADLGRVERQQRFLAAMAARVTSSDVLLDPRALVQFLDAALSAVRADPGLEQRRLVELGMQLRHVSGNDIRFRTVPVADPSMRAPGAGAVALWDEQAAAELFRGLRTDRPGPREAGRTARALTVPPEQIRVQVFNAAGTPGLGGAASQELTGRGFDLAGPAQNWSRTGLRATTIRYDARYTESIKTLAAAVPGARLESVPGLGRTLQVVLGTSYAGTRAVRVRAPSGPTASSTRSAAADPCS